MKIRQQKLLADIFYWKRTQYTEFTSLYTCVFICQTPNVPIKTLENKPLNTDYFIPRVHPAHLLALWSQV